MCHSTQLRLPRTIGSVAAARRWLVTQLAASYSGQQSWEDAVLVVSELATNCLRTDTETFTIAVDVHYRELTVCASDDAAGQPVVRNAKPHDTTGRGLTLISALATGWGIDNHPGDGKTVWADLPVPDTAAGRFPCAEAPAAT